MFRRMGSGLKIVVVQLLSCVQLFVTPWSAACQASLSFTISWSSLKLMSSELVMPFNHLILCYLLLLLPSMFPSISVFSNESALCIRWPKYWSFSISPSSEYSGLIDWFDFLAAQGTLESSPTSHFKSINLWRSAFFMVQLSNPYMTARKTIALTILTFVGKVMSLLLICCLVCHSFSFKEQASFNFMAAVTICSDFGAQENKSLSLFPLFPCLFAMK